MEIKSRKILVVDDSLAARELLLNHLNSLSKYEIICAKNGQEALDLNDKALASGVPFDIIFLDWNMPVMDGLSALKIFRANQRMDNCIIVMLTAESNPNNLQLIKDEKGDFVINKPINAEKVKMFMMKIEAFVRKST